MRFVVVILNRLGLCLALWLSAVLGSPALGGGLGSEFTDLLNPQTFQASTYQIRVPGVADPNYRIPTVVIFHDAGRNGTDITDDDNLIKAFIDKGYAVLAPNALPRRNVRISYRGNEPTPIQLESFKLPFSFSKKKFLMADRDGTVRNLEYGTDSGWYFYNIDRVKYSEGDDVQSQNKFKVLGRDEIQNLRNVLARAKDEYGIDPKPVLIIGLGHGGSLVWQIACHAPNLARLLASVDGAFWHDIPADCSPGARLAHTHHRASEFWPLTGAAGSERRYERTSILSGLEMLLNMNRCRPDKVSVRKDEIGLSHTAWADCPNGSRVELMLLDQAFAFEPWWLDEMLGRLTTPGIEVPSEVPEEPLDTGPEIKRSDSETGFQKPGSETGFQKPGSGTGFQKPGSDSGSRFKRRK